MDMESIYMRRLLTSVGRVANTEEFKARSYPHDSKSTLLVISNWQSVPERQRATVVQFVVSDEDGDLEWTFTAERRRLPSPVQLLLPSTPSSHKLVVQMKILNEDLTNRRTATTAADEDTKCYENLHEVSCKVEHSNLSGSRSTDVFKDFRPRLRENVGMGTGYHAKMIVLAASESVLPMTYSSIFKYDGHEDTLPLVFYEGKDKDVYCTRRLFKLSLSLQPLTRRGEFTAKFDFTEDGTLTATISEESGNVEQCYSPQILDVIGRKLPTNTTEPTLTIAELRGNQVELRINTTYGQSEIKRWQITLTPHYRSAGTTSKSSLFLVPVTGFEQSFQVPMETVYAGTQYGIRVDGLQMFDSGTTEGAAFKAVCSNSTTATLNARAKVSVFDNLLRDFQLEERTPRTPISASTLAHRDLSRVGRATTVASRSIKVERATFHQATVVISDGNARYLYNAAWKITVKQISSPTGPVVYSIPREFNVPATGRTEQRYEFPLQFQPGHSYKVQVEGSGLSETTTFKAELTIDDIRKLHSMAKRHTAGQGSSPCYFLYRNKSYEYFEEVMNSERGIMRVYDKDNSGDPASPINLQIKGLFFMATVERGTNGEPMRQSAFGPVRICIQAEEMLRKAPNLYFVDYYCMRGQNHYVTLVLTKPGSTADLFCQPRLLKLDVNDRDDNPFFFRDTNGQLQVSKAYFLQVELLFTEDLDIRGYPRTHTPTVGKGSSTKGGIRKNPSCSQCNLRGSTGYPAF